MTFTEAALEVLEREGRPMHSREIAERAVAWGLLSHVGKTPVQTMSARISAMVAKGRDKSPFVRVRPGVFALAKWKGASPGPKAVPKAAEAKPAAARAEEPSETAPKKRKRRRRKKRGDGDEAATAPEKAPGTAGESAGERTAPAKPKRKARSAAGRKSTPAPQASKQQPARAAPGKQPDAQRSRRAAGDEPQGIAERAVEVLRGHSGPLPEEALAKALGWKGERAAMLLDSLLTAEGIDRESRGLRPRFVRHRSGWALAEREISAEIVELEHQVSAATDRLARLAERQVLRRLRTLPLKALVRVVTMFLRRQGFDSMSPVERGGRDEFHLSVLDRRGGGRFRTAVVIRRDPADHALPDRAVSDLRGALHHYDSMSALIVTTGAIGEAARTEAAVANLPPVALVDGETLTRELVSAGIGVRIRRAALPTFDEQFFSALGA